ncbi:taste receptor type 2 member 143-like [Sceloporus undulatus]|uniref:taste receptor type 2 member 143-like n=1 Tax=Sceloporus undulatus TaxID=8520 RepID=UPI001C4AE15D|nr:taste receptor type 2 member 143-like [Sceloporus undulatus]
MVNNSTSPLDIRLWDIFSWIIFGIVSLIGILGNGFIVVVNGHQWLQSKKMVPCDFLLTTLSTSRFLVHLILLVNSSALYFFLQSTRHIYIAELIYFPWTLSIMVSHWCATWLSVFYCVKVTSFANPLFLWMKARINVLIPKLLGISIVISMVLYLPLLVSLFGQKKDCNVTGTLLGNVSQNDVCNNIFIILLPLDFFLSFINFCLSTISFILLLTSLQKHRRNMKKSGVTDLSIQVHIKVMKSLLFCFFFYLLYFIAMIIYTKNVIDNGTVDGMLINILLSLFPSVHSIILILTNPKLKEISAHILNIRQRPS